MVRVTAKRIDDYGLFLYVIEGPSLNSVYKTTNALTDADVLTEMGVTKAMRVVEHAKSSGEVEIASAGVRNAGVGRK